MSKRDLNAIPFTDDVVHTFGFLLGQIREPRASREELASKVNTLVNTADANHEEGVQIAQEPLDKKISEIDATISDIEKSKEVSWKLVSDWQQGKKFPSPSQFRSLERVFKEVAPLTMQEEERLHQAYESGKIVVKRRIENNTSNFGEVLRDIVDNRIYEMENPPFNNAKDLARLIEQKGESASLPALIEQRKEFIRRRDNLQNSPQKHRFIMDGGNNIIELKGDKKFSMTVEHVQLLEHGLIPSKDLMETLVLALKGVKKTHPVETSEIMDLEKKYEELVQKAMRHFNPVADEVSPALAPVIETKRAPPAELHNNKSHNQTRDPFNPTTLLKLAAAYREIFVAYNLPTPHIDKALTDPGHFSHIQALLADKTKLNHKTGSLGELTPFSLAAIPEKTSAALVKNVPAGRVIWMQKQCKQYNDLVDQIHSEIAHSQAGKNFQNALKNLKEYLDRGKKGRNFIALLERNEQVGIANRDAKHYFTEVGFSMTNPPKMRAILEKVDALWSKEEGCPHSVLTNELKAFQPPVQAYIEAYENIRALYELQKTGFSEALTTLGESKDNFLPLPKHDYVRGDEQIKR